MITPFTALSYTVFKKELIKFMGKIFVVFEALLEEVKEGILSENFAKVSGKKCVIVDDIISTGRTVRGAIEVIEKSGGKVLGVAVVADKGGRIETVPVKSLLKISRI